MTHIGTPAESTKKAIKKDFMLITSIGITEFKFQKGGCPRSKNTTADWYHSTWQRNSV